MLTKTIKSELVKQGERNDKTNPNEALARPWFQELKQQVEEDNFSKFLGIDDNYGLRHNTVDNCYSIGSSNINIGYNESNDSLVHIGVNNNDFSFSSKGFTELFGTKSEPEMSIVSKHDLVEYARLLKIADIKDQGLNNNKNKSLITPIMKINNNKTYKKQSTINNKVGELYNNLLKDSKLSKLASHQGTGLHTTDTCPMVILSSSIKEMKEKLGLIVTSLKAAYTSTDLKSE